MMRFARNYLFALFLVSQAVRVNAQEQGIARIHKDPLVSQIKYQDNIVYKTVNGENLEMILFLPKVKKYPKMPVVLFPHGGGGWRGDRYLIAIPAYAETLKILTENGIAVASMEYRLVKPGGPTRYDGVVDCKDVGRFLVKNAEKYGIDPEKIGAWGGSAGGHLALMTALAPNEKFLGDPGLKGFDPVYKFIAAYYPTTNFATPEGISRLGESEAFARLISPLGYLQKNSPPILMLHGDSDKAVPLTQSEDMVEAGKKTRANVEMMTIKGAGHDFKGENIQPSMTAINKLSAEFMMKKLFK